MQMADCLKYCASAHNIPLLNLTKAKARRAESGLAHELGNVSIRFVDKTGKEVAGTNTLYQNYPNPFDQRTVIGINLANEMRGTLKITDVSGRVVYHISRDWSKDIMKFGNRMDLRKSGVLYYFLSHQDSMQI